MAHDVFISYSSKDKPTADALCNALETAGIRCWIAPRDILPGLPWASAIIDAIHASKVMLLVLSTHANASEQVLREVERSVNRAIPIIPFRIEDFELCTALEYYLSVPHWLDAMNGPLEAHIHQLVHTAQALLDRPPDLQSPLPSAAPVPVEPCEPQPEHPEPPVPILEPEAPTLASAPEAPPVALPPLPAVALIADAGRAVSPSGPMVQTGVTLSVMRVLPSVVVVLDTEGHVTSLNPAAERLFETSSGEAVGRSYPEVFGPSLSNRLFRLFVQRAHAPEPGAPQLIEATLPGGRRARLHANLGPLRDGAGQLVGMLFAAEDHTAASEAVDEINEATARAERLRQALQRYVGEAVATSVETRPSFVGLGGVRQPISCLHTDVRGYTTIAEARPPEEVMELLVHYHGAAVAALQGEGALIDRFIGDAILALWNAPTPQENHPRLALRGALALRDATLGVGNDLGYGIGIHTGEAVVGNLGSDRYMNFTAIGDTVNVAARLQAAAGIGEIVGSAALLAAVGPGVRTTPLGELSVKGRRAPVEAYRIEGMET